MKKFGLGIGFVFMVSLTFAQLDSLEERECKRMQLFVGQELKLKNYARATTYYLKGEEICNNYDAKKYNNMIQTIKNTVATEKDKARKKLYIDTLVSAYDRIEQKGFFNPDEASVRALKILQSSAPDREKADSLFTVAFEQGNTFKDEHLSYYYYNLYTMYSRAKDAQKELYKKRMISDYFSLSRKIENEGFKARTLETMTNYFNTVVRTCDDILPELLGFMSDLPQEKDKKKKAVTNFLNLLKEKQCTESDEYAMLIDTIISIDNTVDAVLAKAELLKVKKKYKESIEVYRTALDMADNDTLKGDVQLSILEIQYNNLNSFKSAYNTAMSISGLNRSKALMVASNCVAGLANTCGSSTFDRKCNYYYAAQLATNAGESSLAAKYLQSCPSSDEIFSNNSPKQVTLSCWGVTVDVK
ncbi:MAG: hypothetical protein ISP70_01235 [Crocinitomicaceae bacterium]|nr:hypothetical protein [Crocinitomicaceae bacterium]